jgi:hypothetical protein
MRATLQKAGGQIDSMGFHHASSSFPSEFLVLTQAKVLNYRTGCRFYVCPQAFG